MQRIKADDKLLTGGVAGAGVVVALGPDVDPDEWKIGDRAGVKPYYSTCGKCRLCKTGEGSQKICARASLASQARTGGMHDPNFMHCDLSTPADDRSRDLSCVGVAKSKCVKSGLYIRPGRGRVCLWW